MRPFKIYGIWPQASKDVRMLTHFRNAVPLVWGSLRLAPINNLNPKDPLLSRMLRCPFFISAKFDFDLIAGHFCPGPQSSKDSSHLPPVLVESFKQILDWNSCRWTSWFSSFLAMPLPLLHYVLINQQSNAITISVLPRT